MIRRKVRLELGPEQLQEMRDLLDAVPQTTVIHRQWETEEGRAFLRLAGKLYQQGFPNRWMARELGLDERILLQLISGRRRKDLDTP